MIFVAPTDIMAQRMARNMRQRLRAIAPVLHPVWIGNRRVIVCNFAGYGSREAEQIARAVARRYAALEEKI